MTTQASHDTQNELQTLLRSAGLTLDVDVDDGAVTLSGLVLNDEERQAALDLAGMLPGVTTVDDQLELVELVADTPDAIFADDEADDLTNDPMLAADEGIPYFPPTDPPVEGGEGRDSARVADGFLPTAMADDDELDEQEFVDDERRNDDAELVDRVMLELAEDAMTSHMSLYVSALGGIVVLSGIVRDDTDSDAAVAVAERVEGVAQVIDRIALRLETTPATAIGVSRELPLRPARKTPSSAAWRATVISNRFRLQTQREQLEEQIAFLERDLASYGVEQGIEGRAPSHNADLGTDMSQAETIVAELGLMRGELNEVEDALTRMDEGRYGICENCGRPIDRARLSALPLARYDLRCQRLLEERVDA